MRKKMNEWKQPELPPVFELREIAKATMTPKYDDQFRFKKDNYCDSATACQSERLCQI